MPNRPRMRRPLNLRHANTRLRHGLLIRCRLFGQPNLLEWGLRTLRLRTEAVGICLALVLSSAASLDCGDSLSSLDSVQRSSRDVYSMELNPDFGRRGKTVLVVVEKFDAELEQLLADAVASAASSESQATTETPKPRPACQDFSMITWCSSVRSRSRSGAGRTPVRK